MKKFLLLICLSLFSLVSFAQVDTIYFKPGEPGNVELIIHDENLEEDQVSWFIGFPDMQATFDTDFNGSNETTATVCAINVSTSDVFKDMIITAPDGKKYLHAEEIADKWFPYSDVRTITLFNVHQPASPITRTVTDYFGTWYDRTDLEGFVCDTIAVLHILKDFTKVTVPEDVVSSFQVNKSDANAVGITLGDTVKFTAKVVEPLDIEQYALVANEEAIAVSDTGYFELVPNESIDGIQLVVTNATGELVLPWAKSVVVYPPFMISELYSSVTSGEVTTINRVEGTNTTELNIFNHDSVRLKVSTNIEETIQPDAGVRYAWNKDGQNLPEGINVVNKNSLDIPEYDKETMDGTYNCIVTSGDNTITVSYKITSQWPTANEDITADAVKVFVKDSNIWVDNVTNKQVRIVNAIGQVVYTKMITSTGMSVNVPSGIYFVVVDDTTYKVIVK